MVYANKNEDANNTLLKIMPIYSNISVVVGPEGGFSQNELKMLSYRDRKFFGLLT
jgi:16S rRNA U1498 N3-methylase RsmE